MNRRVTRGVCTWRLLLAIVALSVPVAAGAQSLPAGWAARDIGSVGAAGNASGSNGSFTVRGAGADIWGSADGFQFVYRTMTGDGEIVTRVNSVDYLNAWSKAGVMMRESLSPGAAHAYMLASAGKGLAFQRRPYTDGASTNTAGNGGPGYFLKITRSGNTFDAYQSADGVNWAWVGSEWINMPATIYAGVAVTSHYYGAAATATFSGTIVNEWAATAVSGGGSEPSGWSHGDIGAVAASGWSSNNGSDISVGGSGADVWGGVDEFHFAYRTLAGDGSIVARVSSLDWVDTWSKGGVMMRESLTPSSAHVFMLVSAGKGLAFQRRASTGGSSTNTAGPGAAAPYYVKLVRTGNTFYAYASADGANWIFVGSEWIQMASTIHVGVAVTSHADGAVAGANFSGVTVVEGSGEVAAPAPTAPAPPPPPPAETGSPTNTGSPAAGTGSTLRVMHWNTHHLTGTDGVFDPYRIAYWIARSQPDIVSLNEVDDDWLVEQISDALAAQTGFRWNATFSGWGNLILTRLPMVGSDVCRFNPGAARVAAHMSALINGRTINLWSAHLATDSTGTRMYEVANLQACQQAWGEARLIAGDFNMQAFSPEYLLGTTSWLDGWAAAKANGTAINFPGNCDGCTRNSRIDYIFSSFGAWFLSVQSAEVIDTRDGYGTMASDHRPIVVTYNVQ